jgi:hypothetical protein
MPVSIHHWSIAGSADHANQDACAVNVALGRLAVADGVGMSIFQQEWAGILTTRCANSDVVLGNAKELGEWVGRCREEWFRRVEPMVQEMLRNQERSWLGLRVYRRDGAAATLLALSLLRLPTGLGYLAYAVGDCCFLHFRDGQCIESFPFTAAEAFDYVPDQISSLRRAPVPSLAHTAGRCLPGDLLVAATDAIAAYLLAEQPWQADADFWSRMSEYDLETWSQWASSLQERSLLRYDDLTLAICQIRPDAAAGNAGSPPHAPG